jgi:hypothetical protein
VPRSGWVKPTSDQRLSDHISIGVLTRVFPPELVDEVVVAAGRMERRHRLLPARMVVYYVLAMALFADSSYEEVMRKLTEGLAWASEWQHTWEVPSKVAISLARRRLGREPLQLLFEASAQPLADEARRGAFYRGLRLMSLDDTCVDVADTPQNNQEFSRPGSSQRGREGAFLQLHLVGLCESGTHAITSAALGPYSSSEQALADRLIGRFEEDMLCLVDRNFYSYERFLNARQTGAQLLWRVKSSLVLEREQALGDGSYLTRIYGSPGDRCAKREGERARVVKYSLGDRGLQQAGQHYRLLCTILDPEQAPASELAALYCERWEIKGAMDELKTHQRSPRAVLRSKHPDGVYQEAYGYLCTHYAIRRLMHDAVLQGNIDPDRLSFTRSLRSRAAQHRHPAGIPTAQPPHINKQSARS